jgi:hypothetical protein
MDPAARTRGNGQEGGTSLGVGFNDQGQVALTVKIVGIAGDALAPLTPSTR